MVYTLLPRSYAGINIIFIRHPSLSTIGSLLKWLRDLCSEWYEGGGVSASTHNLEDKPRPP